MSSIVATRWMHSTCRRGVGGIVEIIAIGNKAAISALPSMPLGIGSSSSVTTCPPRRNLASGKTRSFSSRLLSRSGEISIGRFREALEEYRAKNHSQIMPPRFRKKITHVLHTTSTAAASWPPTSIDDQKEAAIKDIERFLQNIGVLGDAVTHEDVANIVSEVGESSVRAEEEIRADRIVWKLFPDEPIRSEA